MKKRTNGKRSQIFCFKLLKDGNLLCEALVQNCSDYHIFLLNLEQIGFCFETEL